jgi:hypothetical protein
MGNRASCGIGILNTSDTPVNVRLTMGAGHYWEDTVPNGEIFYRWPGAVFYTVYVYWHNNDNVSAVMRYCYAGGNGTWLIAEDYEGERDGVRRLRLKLASRREIFRNGNFTNYSHCKYQTIPLECTLNCARCRRNDELRANCDDDDDE